jgi:hypothetical protein
MYLACFGVVAMFAANALAQDVALQPHPLEECREGGDFIRNAAMSRDNGIARDFFMSRLADDLLVIRSFPPQLRWFARNEYDEALLTNAAASVFDAPKSPRRHEIEFVDECMQSPQWRLQSVDNGKSPADLRSAMR